MWSAPFCGTSTSLFAAKRLKKHGVIEELDPHHKHGQRNWVQFKYNRVACSKSLKQLNRSIESIDQLDHTLVSTSLTSRVL